MNNQSKRVRSETSRVLAAWGARGGQSRSDRKIAAARENLRRAIEAASRKRAQETFPRQ